MNPSIGVDAGMPIMVMPQTVVTLSQFLESNELTLLVRQTGTSKWEASFEPEVLEDADEADVRDLLTIERESSQEAVQAICEFLSGHDGLSVCYDGEELVDLDLYYTKVECDWVDGEKNPDTPKVEEDSGTPSLLKGALRHHGGE